MFTGIVQSIAQIAELQNNQGIRTFEVRFEEGFCEGLEVGASVSVDGVCLTVTEILSDTQVKFDVMIPSLEITTLSELKTGAKINVERAAKDGAEVGGHILSGHVDFKASIIQINQKQDNYCIRVKVDKSWLRYIFAKGYIAMNGASLTISEVNKQKGWFEVWLIPETRRMTTFEAKEEGSYINIEIERTTQVMVDTVRESLNETFGGYLPLLKELAKERNFEIDL